MYIRRLRVVEGFLDGLDIEFARGLNVIIGARGTGKTSVIELIRYCLGAPAFTEEAGERGLRQALSVLQGGRVEVTLSNDAGEVTVSRDAQTQPAVAENIGLACTVLAQSEIEAVGAQPGGRLHLVDRFRSVRSDLERGIQVLSREVASLTDELQAILEEGRKLSDQTLQLSGTGEALVEATLTQQQVLESIEASAQDRTRLTDLQEQGSVLAVRSSTFARTADALRGFSDRLLAVIEESAHLVEQWPAQGGPDDLLRPIRSSLDLAQAKLRAALDDTTQALTQLNQLGTENQAAESALSMGTRELRQQLEALQLGASTVTRRVAELQERFGQLQALEGLLNDRRHRFLDVQKRRDDRYEAINELREQAFEERVGIANRLNDALGPAVRIRIARSGASETYSQTVAAALRGTGLHYNTLAPLIAKSMSPLELVSAAEGGSVAALCDATGLTPDRAGAVIAALQNRGLSDIASVGIDDSVTIELLDGSEYKDSSELSIGQRCTVVLPILLSQHGDPLLVDQPEDHLDNAFIATTLVPSLSARTSDDQFILASHNANIPVLGNADRVVVMGSDGKRGFALHCGDLDDPATVQHVTSLMEGGLEAFERRADFYGVR